MIALWVDIIILMEETEARRLNNLSKVTQLESDRIRIKPKDFYSKACDLNLCTTLYRIRDEKQKLRSRFQGNQMKELLRSIRPISRPFPVSSLKLAKLIFPKKWVRGVFSSSLLCWSPNKPTGLVVL